MFVLRRSSRFHRLFTLVVFIAIFIGNKCNSQTPPSVTPTAVSPTPNPIGLSRENPLNGLETISLKNWEVRVLDMVRGPEAWKHIHDANQFNDPPPDGWDYILIQFDIEYKGTNSEEKSLGIHLTGNANFLYYSFNNSIVPPEPILDNSVAGGRVSQGWDVFLVKEDEGDLMLVLDDLSDYEEPEHFARLDERATLAVPTSLGAIEATDLGSGVIEPLPFGQIATSEAWQITVQEVQQGQEAWTRVQEANPFNDPPPEGQMYLLVKIWLRYIGTDSLGASVSRSDFVMVNHDKQQVRQASVSGLEGGFPLLKLYPSGEYEGWLAFVVGSGDGSLVLAFSPGFLDENVRYLSLLQNGR